ncbi:trypco2 family protein [Streptomyces sp. NPDC055992]|uniref:trypco2 family protein n=1 Tax=Streptomyces sp. NPDC055992 TaxID=3345673 RepID=UPI0035DF1CE7
MTDGVKVELAQAVKALRAELQAAATEGDGQAIRFEVGPVEVQFDVQVVRAQGAQAKVYVINGKLDRTTTEAHHVKLTLIPQNHAGRSIQVNGVLSGIPED